MKNRDTHPFCRERQLTFPFFTIIGNRSNEKTTVTTSVISDGEDQIKKW